MNPAVPQKSAVVVPHRPSWRGRVAARLIYVLIRLVACSIRFRLPEDYPAYAPLMEQPTLFGIWHNRLSLCLMLYDQFIRDHYPGRRLAAMVSASRDGGVLARVLELFQVQPVRGSSSRRGRQALLEMVSWAEKGYDLALTPDGPRGPRYQVQEGIVALAQLTGRPIIPACYHLNWKIRIKSWDGFQIPLPFACCNIRLGPPLHIPRETTDQEREQLRLELEKRLRAITQD
jgi:lysophospholipid acyltransferase (LPLAT)-like uncharacterized protein